MNYDLTCDIAVLGGGASGLAAAIEAARTADGASVMILERLDRTGKKILATGGGRCNLGNTNKGMKHYSGSIKNAAAVFKGTPSPDRFFSEMGMLCAADDEGRLYPYSRSAASVLDSLRLKADELGVKEICGFEVIKIEEGRGIALTAADGRTAHAKRVIIACGGYAAPNLGTDGKMLGLLRDIGCRVEKICPAVAPLRVSGDSIKGLKGIRIKGSASAYGSGQLLQTEEGEIQFTENSISGICVFNLAHYFRQFEGKMSLVLDLCPEQTEEALTSALFGIKNTRKSYPLSEFLSGLFVKNMAQFIMKKAVKIPLTEPNSRLAPADIKRIAQLIKRLEFKVTGCSSWQNAQATSGGVSGTCVDDSLMWKGHSGIYFAGEILDIVGECGGYNLQWAWASGIWAGRNAALSLVNKRR